MPEAVARAYNSLDAYEQKEVLDFIYFIISRRDAGDEPNEETAQVLADVDAGRNMSEKFSNMQDFWDSLNA